VEKSLVIFGTVHRVQGALKAPNMKHVDDPDYKQFVEGQLRTNHFDFVFEEATGFGPTIAEDLATKILSADHYLDVDPSPKTRAQFGIPPLHEERVPLGEGYLIPEDLDVHALREELWVKRCTDQPFSHALFICGHLHTLSLSFRLRKAGFAVVQASAYIPYRRLGT
jgi:hypothetical protein